jgi:hypothetical protein
MDESTDDSLSKKQYEFVSRWSPQKDRLPRAHLLRIGAAGDPLRHSVQQTVAELPEIQDSPKLIQRAIIRFIYSCSLYSAITTEPSICASDAGVC